MRNDAAGAGWSARHEPRVDTYHDRIRETVLGHLEDGPRRDLHRTLAGVIERSGAAPTGWLDGVERDDEAGEAAALPRRTDLAYHYDAAGDALEGATYGLLAAEQARRQSALEVAVNNYALASRNAKGGRCGCATASPRGPARC